MVNRGKYITSTTVVHEFLILYNKIMLKDKVFRMFIVGTGSNFDYAIENKVGGFIFFTKDIVSKSQFTELINKIKTAYSNDFTPILSIDQEGGRVERTENLHPKKYLSPKYALEKGGNFLTEQTKEMLTELKELGINMNFAPCLDVNSNPDNPIIGERAFSNNPAEVCKGWDIVYPVYKEFGIIPVIKHFPGHGDTNKDSHLELPQINLSFSELEQTHIHPFKHAIENGANFVMVAHLHCTSFDTNEIPTSLSKNCINYLRENLNFKGVTISDDMYMKGLSKYGMTEACLMGIKAGLNMFIYRDSSDDTIKVIEDVIREAEKDIELREKINFSYNKIRSIL